MHVRWHAIQGTLDFVANILKAEPAKSVFNYVLSIYGHMPHITNTKKRPPVLELPGGFLDAQLAHATE